LPESINAKNFDHNQKKANGKSWSNPPKAAYNYSTIDESATLALTKIKQVRNKEKEQ